MADITGTSGNDTLNGGIEDDFIRGLAGADALNGGGGDDRLAGGAGADTIDGGEGRDTLDYSESAAISIIRDDNGNLVTTGGEAAGDSFSNVEVILGSANDDVIELVNGLEEAFGDEGDDRFIMGDHAETIDGSSGFDIADYRKATGGIRLDLSNVANNTGFAAGDTFAGIESFVGSNFDDVMIGTSGDDKLFGLDGDDVLIGGAGADRLGGGAGVDTLDYSASDAAISVQLFSNSAAGGHAEGDNISEIENVIGTDFDDAVAGTEGDNVLTTGDGDDVVNGRGGFDKILAGAGNDTIRGSDGGDVIDGGEGFDTLDYSQSAAITIRQNADGTVVTKGGLAAGDDFTNVEALLGSDNDDKITAVNGLQEIFGGEGDDILIGSDSSLRLNGGDGDDRLFAGSSGESIEGGAGTDIVDYRKATEAVRIDLSNLANNTGFAAGDTYAGIENFVGTGFDDVMIGTSGDDRLFGGDGDDVLIGGAGADRLGGGKGIDTLDYSGSNAAISVQLFSDSAAGGHAEGDIIRGDIENLIGTDFDDAVAGTEGDNVLSTGDGDDVINGRGGFDTIFAGAGNDEIRGSEGADVIDGGEGFDTVTYRSSSQPVVIGREGPVQGGEFVGDTFVNVEKIIGSTGNDALVLQDGMFNLSSVEGNDRLTAFGGTFEFFGGTGNDILELVLGEAAATGAIFAGQAGTDTLLISGASGAEDFRDDQILDIEQLAFTSGLDQDYEVTLTADQMAGIANVRALTGFRGSEELTINIDMANRATLDLDHLTLTNLSAETDQFVITGGAGVQTINGTGLNDLISGGNGDDVLRGRNGDDKILGGDGNDSLQGDAGNDTIYGGEGNDTISGGAGNDFIDAGEGADTIDGGDGIDTIDYSASDAGVTARLQFNDFSGGHASGDSATGVENLIGTDFADVLTGLNASVGGNLLDGGDGDDVLTGLAGNDVLIGGRGADILDGGADADRLEGGTGNDTLIGGAGSDFIDGQQGHDTVSYATSDSRVRIDLSGENASFFGDAAGDLIRNVESAIGSSFGDIIAGSKVGNTLTGGLGDDVLEGREGKDRLFGGEGDDTLIGGVDNDRLFGDDGEDTAVYLGQAADYTITLNQDLSLTVSSVAEGIDKLVDIEKLSFADQTIVVADLPRVINGTTGADTAIGGAGDDVIALGAGNDVIEGGGGDDTLRGAAGDDTITGGAGSDVIVGGAGADTFIFAKGSDQDSIRDFEQGVDEIELDMEFTPDLADITTAQEMVDTFGTINSAGTQITLDFGEGDVLLLRNKDGLDLATLHEDLILV